MLGTKLPDYYKEGTLLRYFSEKQIYVVRNSTKKAINSMDIFFSNGFKMENVKIVTEKYMIDILPHGGNVD